MKYLCDNQRHLICEPFSVENLHNMAKQLGIGKHWFHNTPNFPHYDIPKRRIEEIKAMCTIVDSKDIVRIIKEDPLFVESISMAKASS